MIWIVWLATTFVSFVAGAYWFRHRLERNGIYVEYDDFLDIWRLK